MMLEYENKDDDMEEDTYNRIVLPDPTTTDRASIEYMVTPDPSQEFGEPWKQYEPKAFKKITFIKDRIRVSHDTYLIFWQYVPK